MPKSYKSQAKGKPAKKAASKSGETVRITFEVDPIVELKLRVLCRTFDLPYPEGIAVVLEKTCALVDKKRKGR